MLAWDAGQLLQLAHRIRERSLGGGPRLEEARLTGEQVAALARLQVDDQALEPASGHQHPLGVPGQFQRVPFLPQGDEQDDEGAADDQGEQSARRDRPGHQASCRHWAQ